jgi:hypothetical protein
MAWRSCAHQVKIRWRPRWLRTFPDPPTSHLCSPLGMSHNPTLPGSARIAWQWLGVLKENLDLFFQLVRSASAPASRRQKWNTVATDTRCLTPSHSPFAKATAGYVASCEVAFHDSMAAWPTSDIKHQTGNSGPRLADRRGAFRGTGRCSATETAGGLGIPAVVFEMCLLLAESARVRGSTARLLKGPPGA